MIAQRDRGQPASLDRVRAARRLGTGIDPLMPSGPGRKRQGRWLRHPDLARLLSDHEMGVWSLGVDTIDFLELEVARLRPRLILEFGSGISTVCLSQFMRDAWPESPDARVISLEQDRTAMDVTRSELRKGRLDHVAEVVHAPLVPAEYQGRELSQYDISGLARLLDGRLADFVVIDGPFAPPGSRVLTLPSVAPHLEPGAHFYLDDALRDGELWAAAEWSRMERLHVLGVRVHDKGVLVGSVRSVRPAR